MEIIQKTIYEFDHDDIINALCEKVGIDPETAKASVSVRHRVVTEGNDERFDKVYYFATVTVETESAI